MIVLGSVLLTVTLVQALYIASPRRTLVLLPEVSALAGLGLTWARVASGRPSAPGDSLAR